MLLKRTRKTRQQDKNVPSPGARLPNSPAAAAGVLQRTTFRTSRLLDFTSRKELIAQTGHEPDDWPLVALKELVDNSLDACEDARIAPQIVVTVDRRGITVADNGPGIPSDTIEAILDFSVRVSNREAYVAPDRGAQGNALKTIVAMPFVLEGGRGQVDIAVAGERHEITLAVDPIRQKPVVSHERRPARNRNVKTGTAVTVHWPHSACSILQECKARFLQIADDYTLLNPHLTLEVDWFGEQRRVKGSKPAWAKWLPSDPTCPHWYGQEHFARLVSAYIAHDQDRGAGRTIREFIAEFRGLAGSAKQKAVLNATGLARMNLSRLANGAGLDGQSLGRLLGAMKQHTRPAKAQSLGIIGKDHLAERFKGLKCKMETFNYRKQAGVTGGAPWLLETAFGFCPEADERRLVAGVNWSVGIINPFRELGRLGQSLDSILEQQRAGRGEPVVLLVHVACPRVEYTDRGKSAVVVEE